MQTPLRNTFFDDNAAVWDSRIKPSDHAALERIFGKINFRSTDTVLDVGSGTGIAIPYYREYGISDIYACERSSGMIEILKEKHPDVKLLHRNYLNPLEAEMFVDKILIFNTFPHFANFEPVFRNSVRYLKPDGQLIIAHSLSRRGLAECHRRKGRGVKNDILPSDEYFREKFSEYGFGEIIIEDPEEGFFASGRLE